MIQVKIIHQFTKRTRTIISVRINIIAVITLKLNRYCTVIGDCIDTEHLSTNAVLLILINVFSGHRYQSKLTANRTTVNDTISCAIGNTIPRKFHKSFAKGTLIPFRNGNRLSSICLLCRFCICNITNFFF